MKQEKRIDEIERLCVEKGLSIYEVFREAKIPASTIANWRRKEPNAFSDYDKLKQTIEELEARPF